MKRVMANEVASYLGEEIVLKGWVYRLRRLSRVNFIILRDRTGSIQVSAEPSLLENLGLSLESVVAVQGRVVADERAPGGFEVAAEKIEVISAAKNLPLNINAPKLQAGLEAILNERVLSLRHSQINPIFKIQAALARGFQKFLDKEGFLQVFTPKIVASGTEGGTELFTLQYFEKEAYLAQSPQFYKQMLVGAGYERVYEIGQVYRAEKHATARHLNEYVSLDLEMGFIENEREIMTLQNRLLAAMFSHVKKSCGAELEALGLTLPPVPQIPRVTLAEALEILEEEYGKVLGEPDLDPEAERLLSGYFLKQTKSEFVFVTDYPQSKRPMYTMPKGEGLTASFDLLFRGLEITTGGQRIHSYELLKENMRRQGLNPKTFTPYLKIFQWGMPPHGGLAIGLERLTAQIIGLKNIRQASLFPRDRHRLTP
ncbi:MAG TPA: aspartate--tRNA(Asn) ligase [Firmicutes bacterium]|nr:aspartate--tRNA(Asn) ligase [Bacillota bacterium]